MRICFSGVKTALERCGRVTVVYALAPDGENSFQVTCVSNGPSTRGDSGSPAYGIRNNGRIRPAGILSGHLGSDWCFSSIQNVMLDMQVKVLCVNSSGQNTYCWP